MAASIQDVANATGVSIMTVSRAMRGVEGVSASKRAEILRIAKKLGYRPNRNAASLAAAHSTLIGISLPTLFDDVFAEILDGMRRTFDNAGLDIVIDVSGYSEQREEAWVERMLDWKPAGVILSGVDHSERVRQRLRQAKIPTLEIWDYIEDPIDICVGIDHFSAGSMIGQHLVRSGYRSAAFVGIEEGRDMRAERRLSGLNAAFEASGLAKPRVERVDQYASFEAGKYGTLALLKTGARPECICYLNDHLAFGGLETCKLLGLSVPDDIGIVGFNGLGINSVLSSPLTTVITPRKLIGSIGARSLLARIHGAKIERATCVPMKLLAGNTIAATKLPVISS